ncbi:MAG: hypothetical protein LBM25_07000 [Bacteroidales bacterium]|jgi:hypothetical protein|nr:hypothetical protein [Bacteroidales bacterium]
MKKIGGIILAFLIVVPVFFYSCKEEEKEEVPFERSIPSKGIYFKAQIGDVIWEGASLAEMYAKREPIGSEDYKMIDLIACTDDESDPNLAIVRKRVYAHVQILEDGSFANYRVQYQENKSTTYPIAFEQWFEYKSGSLKVINATDSTITARFDGVLENVYDYETEEKNVILYFQEFPIEAVLFKK